MKDTEYVVKRLEFLVYEFEVEYHKTMTGDFDAIKNCEVSNRHSAMLGRLETQVHFFLDDLKELVKADKLLDKE